MRSVNTGHIQSDSIERTGSVAGNKQEEMVGRCYLIGNRHLQTAGEQSVEALPTRLKEKYMMDEEEIDIENRLADIFLKRIFGCFLILVAAGLVIAAWIWM